MMPRKYDQDADGNRICPHCRRTYGPTYISQHVRSAHPDQATPPRPRRPRTAAATHPNHRTVRAQTARALADDLLLARVQIAAQIAAQTRADVWTCVGCGAGDATVAPSIARPDLCLRCARGDTPLRAARAD